MRLVAAILVSAALLNPARAEAQLALLNGAGYGGLGLVGGALVGAAIDSDCEGFICIPAGVAVGALMGTATGLIVGIEMANTANHKVEQGEPLSGAHKGGLVVGTALGGAAIGAAALGKVAGGNAARAGAFLGAGLSVVYLHARWQTFSGTGVDVRPGVVGGKAGLVATVHF